MNADRDATAAPTGAGGAPPGWSAPAVALPKGGGAIRGIGERFQVNPARGTGAMTVPVAVSPGRAGFGPSLALSYDSGHGNGTYGLGWALSMPAVSRRTDRGVPRYDDTDVFTLGGEDLIPELDPDDDWRPVVMEEPGHLVTRYRPRVDAAFARIERWVDKVDGTTHWRTTGGDNVTTVYGATAAARIADPADPRRVLTWLVCSTFDDRGNVVVFDHKPEDRAGVDTGHTAERHRTPAGTAANRYLKRIRYGNRVSRLVDPDLTDPLWMFEVVLDYGDHDPDLPTPAEDRPWASRPDPFSSYRAGFELRTYRLCRRVLMFHHFPGEAEVGAGCLVASTDLTYAPDPTATLLTAITHSRYRRTGTGYRKRSLPPAEFGYQPADPHDAVADLDADGGGLPAGLPGPGVHFVDLDGEALAGALTAQAGTWYYQRNLGDGRLAAAEPVATVPARRALGAGQVLLDLDGDGSLDVVDFGGPTPGFHERTDDGQWAPFTPFAELPTVDFDDPNARLVDLDGDGRADLLLTEDEALTWFPSEGSAASARPAGCPPRPTMTGAPAGVRRRHRHRAPGRHVRRRPDRPCPRARWRGLLLAEPRPRSVRPQSDHGGAAALRPPGRLRPGAPAAGRLRRHRPDRPVLPGRRRAPDLAEPGRERLHRTHPPDQRAAGGRADHRDGDRPARHRHRLPGLVFDGAGRRRAAGPLRGPDRWRQALPAQHHPQQPRRRDPPDVRAVHQVLPGRPGGGAAVGYPVAVPRTRGGACRGRRPRQPKPVRQPVRLPPRPLRRLRARVPRLRDGGTVRHRSVRR
ncbi:hypothetical protein Pflav_047260 [Phytohabitans flavus]|uniref:Insecticide toxin TcdB middle/N-terminal domain-containing protein n=1 Tax=Phytohabitans flavus TaxID=1076124 RepID=A0A6F8XWV2_9ACTN|nr:hypothetical protein Pflav_047260 [Phytohabitans flavus]